MIDIIGKARELHLEISNLSAGTINEDQLDVLKETVKALLTGIEEWYATAPAAAEPEPEPQPEATVEEQPHEESEESEEEPSEEEESAEEESSSHSRSGRGGSHRGRRR